MAQKQEIIILEYGTKIDMQDNLNINFGAGFTLIQGPTIIFDSADNPTYLATIGKFVESV